ncbi:hypothetical protein ACFL5M_02335 [Candidatus Neomarinimicrobiota bacterium]
MSRFIQLLQRINHDLDVAQPVKSRIILEIHADLNDLYELYCEQGMEEADAQQQAEQRCNVSEQAVEQLKAVHASGVRRAMDRLSEQAQSRVERIGLVTIMAVLAILSGRIIFTSGFMAQTSTFIWGALAIAVLAGAIGIAKAYRFYLKRDHRTRTLRNGLSSILFLAGGGFVNGLFGYLYEMYRAVHRSAADFEGVWLYIIDWLVRGSSAAIVSLWVCILSAALWYLLETKAVRIERAEAESLLEL